MVFLKNCRLCQDRNGIVKLDNNSALIQNIYKCVGIKIDLVEDSTVWPRLICEQCNTILELFQQFRVYAWMVDQNLRNAIRDGSVNTKKEVVKEIIFLQFDGEESFVTDSEPLDFLQGDTTSETNDVLEEVTEQFQCPVCHMMYFTAEGLEIHKRSHTELCCFNCQKVFDNIEKREKHICNDLSENDSVLTLKPNVKVVPVIIKEEINITNHNTLPLDDLESEAALSSSDQQSNYDTQSTQKNARKKNVERTCPSCGEKFENKLALMRHMKTHVGSFVCTFENCGKVCKSEYALKYHIWKHKNSNNQLLCKVCGKSFQFASYLKQHEQRHTGIKEFKCEDCGKEFFRKAELDIHSRAHHQGVRYFCSICTKSFMTYMNLQRHEIVHSGIKQFICEQCSKQFYTEKELIRHRKRSHQGVKPHVCEYCAKSFFEKTQYRVHIRCHTGERPFVCSNTGCSKSYYEKSHLKSHKKNCDKKLPQERSQSKEQAQIVVEEPEMVLKDVDIITEEYVC